MSVEQLQTVVAIAEEGAVVRAAQRLNLTQPPVTRRLQALEDELGVPLFERQPRGMALTPAGAVFVDHARSILGALQRAAAAVHDATCHDATCVDPKPLRLEGHKEVE